MNLEFYESNFGLEVILKPENKEELAKLLRFTTNAKQEKPSISLFFGGEIRCSIFMKKVKESVQSNTIKPRNK